VLLWTPNDPESYPLATYDLVLDPHLTDPAGHPIHGPPDGTLTLPHLGESDIVWAKPSESPLLSASQVGNDRFMHGRPYVNAVGLYDHRARWYEPATQGFLQIDPLGPVDSPNLYQAFGFDAFNVTDPFGLQELEVSLVPDGSLLSYVQPEWVVDSETGEEVVSYPAGVIVYVGIGTPSDQIVETAWLVVPGASGFSVLGGQDLMYPAYQAELIYPGDPVVDQESGLIVGFDADGSPPQAITSEDVAYNLLYDVEINVAFGVLGGVDALWTAAIRRAAARAAVEVAMLEFSAETRFGPSLVPKSTVSTVATKRNSAGQLINEKGQFLGEAGGDSAAAAAGREAHSRFDELVMAKPGWEHRPRITDPSGELSIPDALDLVGRPVELKPATRSGYRRGRRAIARYQKVTERKGRVIYYDPETGQLLPFWSPKE